MRGGYAGALAHIRKAEGLSRRKAKRRLLLYIWRLTSVGLRMVERKRQGKSYIFV